MRGRGVGVTNGVKFLVAGLGLIIIYLALGIGAYWGAISASGSVNPIVTAYSEESKENRIGYEGNDSESDKEQRENRDLAAQEAMAVWAKWMFLAGVSQAFLSAAALFMLFKDFRQNRLSAESQLRAYLTVECKGIVAADESDNGQIIFEIKNWGQTPAYNVTSAMNIAFSSTPIDYNPNSFRNHLVFDDRKDSLGPGQSRHGFGFLHEMDLDLQVELRDKMTAIIQWGVVNYSDVFGISHETQFCFYLWGEVLDENSVRRGKYWNSAS